MKKYYIQNRITFKGEIIWANSAQEACSKCGWMTGDCHVKELTDLGKKQENISIIYSRE